MAAQDGRDALPRPSQNEAITVKVAAVVPLLCAAVLAGCGSDSSVNAPAGGSTDDRQLIRSVLAREASLVDAAETLPVPARSSEGVQADPVAVRDIGQAVKELDFELTEPDPDGRPTLAVVTVNRRLMGTIERPNEMPPGPEGALSVYVVDDFWTRHVTLRRTDSSWRIVAISGVNVVSEDHHRRCQTCGTTSLHAVRLVSAASDVDVTINDPLRNWTLEGAGEYPIARLDPGALVTLTLQMRQDLDLGVVGYRAPRNVFAPVARYTQEARVQAPTEPGIHHIPVGVLTSSPGPSGPYDSVAWFIPVRVAPAGAESRHAARRE
jgi:hypothetical protein